MFIPAMLSSYQNAAPGGSEVRVEGELIAADVTFNTDMGWIYTGEWVISDGAAVMTSVGNGDTLNSAYVGEQALELYATYQLNYIVADSNVDPFYLNPSQQNLEIPASTGEHQVEFVADYAIPDFSLVYYGGPGDHATINYISLVKIADQQLSANLLGTWAVQDLGSLTNGQTNGSWTNYGINGLESTVPCSAPLQNFIIAEANTVYRLDVQVLQVLNSSGYCHLNFAFNGAQGTNYPLNFDLQAGNITLLLTSPGSAPNQFLVSLVGGAESVTLGEIQLRKVL